MAGYIGSKAVSVNTTSATISDDLAVGDDLTVTDDATIGGTLGVTGVLTATSLDISGDIDVDGTTNLDVVDIDGAVDMASTLAVAGVVTANAGVVVDNFTLDGTTLALSSGDMTLDIAGELIIDTDLQGEGNGILLKDDGTTYGNIFRTESDLIIMSVASDEDLLFKGNDNGSTITALTLDMSDAGAAHFNTSIYLGDGKAVKLGASSDLQIYHDGTHSHIDDTGTGYLVVAASRLQVNNAANNAEMIVAVEGAQVELFHNNAKKLNTTATGVAITGGIAIGGTGTANTLDDYEEGTWTPTVSVGYSSPSYAYQVGHYTKIGNTVRATFRVGLNGGTGNSSGVVFSGLPYTSVNNGSVYPVGTHYTNNASAGGENSKLLVFPNNTKVHLFIQNATNVGPIAGATSGNALDVLGQVIYEAE